MLAASIAGRFAVVPLVMLLFRSSTVQGLILNAIPFSSTHKKKFTGVMSGDQGGQSPFEIILSPKKLSISPRAQINM
jgi:hypothetical protein